MIWAETPRDVAEQSDIVFSMVTNTQAVEAITQGADGIIAGMTSGKIYVDMSTMRSGLQPGFGRAGRRNGRADARCPGFPARW